MHEFIFLSSRLNFVEVTSDQMLNIELFHCLNVFENHVYGVFSQYNRIKTAFDFSDIENLRRVPGPQGTMDIYYYMLTWDKLKKIYERFKALVNKILKQSLCLPGDFVSDYRGWRRRIEALFSEFADESRNEYEHPSLEPHTIGNIIMWGTSHIDGSGDIKTHVGKNCFVFVRERHLLKLNELRVDLFDIFIKHFSQKPLTGELIKVKYYIEENIDTLLEELRESMRDAETEDSNRILHELIMYDIYLSGEGLQLSEAVKEKIYSFMLEQ